MDGDSINLGMAHPSYPSAASDDRQTTFNSPSLLKDEAPLLEPLEVGERSLAKATNRGVDAMNRDELDGKAKEMKGKIKQGVGDLTDDENLRDEGERDEAEGEGQAAFGKARRKVGEAIEDIGEKVKR
jgi:uncharacterized protein YjbJ (UPF0337 family)